MNAKKDKIAFKQGVINVISFLSIFFILNFMFSLIVVAICLAINLEALANNISVYAYYSLLIGVIMQLISSIVKGREEKSRVDR